MSAPKVGYATGKCSQCGKTYTRKRPSSPIVCDCYKFCPLCEQEMTPYTPDLTPTVYQSEKGVKVLYVCNNHTPPHYSTQTPVEVVLT